VDLVPLTKSIENQLQQLELPCLPQKRSIT
jgi:hypothetical protein